MVQDSLFSGKNKSSSTCVLFSIPRRDLKMEKQSDEKSPEKSNDSSESQAHQNASSSLDQESTNRPSSGNEQLEQHQCEHQIPEINTPGTCTPSNPSTSQNSSKSPPSSGLRLRASTFKRLEKFITEKLPAAGFEMVKSGLRLALTPFGGTGFKLVVSEILEEKGKNVPPGHSSHDSPASTGDQRESMSEEKAVPCNVEYIQSQGEMREPEPNFPLPSDQTHVSPFTLIFSIDIESNLNPLDSPTRSVLLTESTSAEALEVGVFPTEVIEQNVNPLDSSESFVLPAESPLAGEPHKVGVSPNEKSPNDEQSTQHSIRAYRDLSIPYPEARPADDSFQNHPERYTLPRQNPAKKGSKQFPSMSDCYQAMPSSGTSPSPFHRGTQETTTGVTHPPVPIRPSRPPRLHRPPSSSSSDEDDV